MNKLQKRRLKEKLNNNKNKIIIIVIIAFIVSLSSGYALYNKTLNIGGKASIGKKENTCDANIDGNFTITGSWGQSEGARITINNKSEELLEDFQVQMKVPDGTSIGPVDKCIKESVDSYIYPDSNGIITIEFVPGESGDCQWLSQIPAASNNDGNIVPGVWAGGSGFNFEIQNDDIDINESIYPEWVSVAGCTIFGDNENQDSELQSLTLSPAEKTIGIGEVLNLTTTKKPSYKKVDLVYSSSDDSVATVDQNGVVTGIGVGTATITVSAEGKSAISTITVVEEVITAESIRIVPSSYKMTIGEVVPLQIEVTPSNASVDLTWSSSNPEVATVDSNGNVTAISKGSTTITAQDGTLQSTCSIRVVDSASSTDVNITREILNGPYVSGSSFMFKITIENLTDEQIDYFKIGLDVPTDVTFTLWQNNVETSENYLEMIESEWSYISANGTFTIQGSISFPESYLYDTTDEWGNEAKAIPEEYLNLDVTSIEIR